MEKFTCYTCGRKTEYDGDGYWRCHHCNQTFLEGYDEDGETINNSEE